MAAASLLLEKVPGLAGVGEFFALLRAAEGSAALVGAG
jgi:hypothetical protein